MVEAAKMAKVVTILLILTIGTLWIHVPHKGEIGFLLNPKVHLSYNQYVWLFSEHLILLALAVIIWDESREYKDLMLVFVFIQVMDMIGFILSYDDPLKDYVLTFNILKLLIFLLAIVIWKMSKRK